jgi:hypothetical protein
MTAPLSCVGSCVLMETSPRAMLVVVGSFFLLFVVAFAEMTRREHRVSQGCCPACGYDLRAHAKGERCPECGTAVTPDAAEL